MAKELRIPYGLYLDFTPANYSAGKVYLTLDTTGLVTKASTIPAADISAGGDLTEDTSSVLTITGGTGAVLDNVTIQVAQADTDTDGYLSSTDWDTFNNKLGTSLTSAYLFVGNGSDVATGVPVSGDITMANTGEAQIAAGVIVNADVNANAAIEFTKMKALTASRAAVTDGGGFVVVSSVTAAQVGYLANLSADLQATINTINETIVTLATSATLQAPDAAVDGYAIIWDEGNSEWTLGPVGAGGSVTGPGASTDNALVRWNGADGTSIQNSAVIVDDSNNITGVTSITVGQSGLHIFDTGDDHDLILASGENLTADHTLTFVLGDADRTVTLSGSPTMGDWFDQSVKAAASVVFADATLSNAGGLHLLDSDSSHDLIIRTTSNLTADRELIFVTGDLTRTLTINASGTVYVTGGTDVAVADGGTGLSSIAALSILVANSLDTFVALTPGAGNSIRVNAGGTAWEAYTPGGGGIGGSTGATDNAILRADGTGGSTVQSSSILLDDTANLTLGLTASTTGAIRTLTAAGTETDIDIALTPKGTQGRVRLTNNIQVGGNVTGGADGINGGISGVFTLYTWNGAGSSGSANSSNGILLKTGAGGTGGNTNSGNIFLNLGAKNGTGTVGNIGLFVDSVADWQDMEKGMFIGNITTEPTAAIANGIAVYSVDESAATILGIRTETAAVTEAATPDTTILIKYNGALYKLVAEAV